MEIIRDTKNWKKSETQVFWGEISPCEHVVQIYQSDDVFLDLLNSFVSHGLRAGDCVIVIATDEHIAGLERRLTIEGYNIFEMKLKDQYIPLNAEETLSTFMINGWPDDVLFKHLVTTLVSRAKRNGRQVRAFGEMVAVLWAQGHTGATVHLEHLWHKFCETDSFCLYCAYPESGFTQNSVESLTKICRSHSKMISSFNDSAAELYYRNMA